MSLAFLLDADPVGRECRVRVLQAMCMVYAGFDHPATQALSRAIADPMEADAALVAVERLPSRLRRRLLTSVGVAFFGPSKGRKLAVYATEDDEHCPRCGF
jgi:hypothetical protein